MKRYSKKNILSVKNDRKKGMSIHALMHKYNMPKTSIWHHIQCIELSGHQKKILRSNQGGSRERKQRDLERARVQALELLKDFNVDSVAPVILASLYWAEGHKKGFVFTNTDKDMLQIFLKVLKKYWHVDNKDINLLIRITSDMDRNKCIAHWRKITKIPLKNIHININNKQNKSKTIYGICRITVKKGGYGLKLTHAVINEIIAQMGGSPSFK